MYYWLGDWLTIYLDSHFLNQASSKIKSPVHSMPIERKNISVQWQHFNLTCQYGQLIVKPKGWIQLICQYLCNIISHCCLPISIELFIMYTNLSDKGLLYEIALVPTFYLIYSWYCVYWIMCKSYHSDIALQLRCGTPTWRY